jgi:RecA/RadA recombinase
MTIADELLSFTFSGDPPDPIKRLHTRLWSFDHAFETAKGDIGMPLGVGYEVYGLSSIGKSTWCYSMAGILANLLETNIHLTDLEGFDAKHLANILSYLKFSGDIHLGHQGTDEEILEKFADMFYVKDGLTYGIGILDSIAAISPISEKEGDFGGATFGRRAVLMGLLSRRLLPTIHPRTVGSEKVYFLINHWYPKVGGTKYQYESPGGNVKNFLCGMRIHLKRSGKPFPDGSYLLEGVIDKNRYGFHKKEFKMFMKAGIGIHPGLTAMFDAFDAGKADRGKVIKIGDQSYGYLKDIINKEWENDEFFQPFYDVMETKDD